MLNNSKKIAVVGVGAVGSYLGAFLSREGYDVTLIDMWGIHVDTMKSEGLKVTGCQGDFTIAVNAVHLTDAINIPDKFDIILLAVKSYDTEWAAHFAKRLLSNQGVIVSNQNCMNDSLIGVIGNIQNSLRDEVVSNQDTSITAPFRFDSFMAAPQGGFIDHIIMEKGGCVNIFNGTGMLDSPIPVFTSTNTMA